MVANGVGRRVGATLAQIPVRLMLKLQAVFENLLTCYVVCLVFAYLVWS